MSAIFSGTERPSPQPGPQPAPFLTSLGQNASGSSSGAPAPVAVARPPSPTNGPDELLPDELGGDDDGEEDSPAKRAKIANKLACQRCRQLKARCEPAEPKNGKCVRCTRLNFDCVWVESQKRGRKANSAR